MHLDRYPRIAGVAALAVATAALVAACTRTNTSSVAPSSTKCQVSANAEPAQFGAGGGRGSLTIRAARECGWTVAPQAAWVSVDGTTSGQGNAVLSYAVASNPRPVARASELAVDDARVQLTQAAAACTFGLSARSATVAASGGTITFRIETLDGCAWTASADEGWLTLLQGRSGNTSELVEVQVAANPGEPRSGIVRAGGQTFTVTQAAAITPTPAPAPAPSPSPTPSPDPVPAPTPPSIAVTFDGTVANLSGSCPSVRFTAGGRTVTTTSSTSFDRRCRDLSNGDSVTVRGLAYPDGTVEASDVQITNNER